MGETFTGRDFYSGGFFLGGREFSVFFSVSEGVSRRRIRLGAGGGGFFAC